MGGVSFQFAARCGNQCLHNLGTQERSFTRGSAAYPHGDVEVWAGGGGGAVEIKKKEWGRVGKSGWKPLQYSIFIKILHTRSAVTELTDQDLVFVCFFSTLGW